ncbi:MAG: 1-acyl-sn-glycerol-3-phosphate acyltransferase [Candidatus Nanopelagicales bacterium]|nr:1-acyl-sn-glycerol-3-phosphate acyltransferase [Actinomycetota bacterium]HNL51193.1 1-acyl-sn-glycerol-3-phosphate acyltransferase [Actinomycetota bacterium]HNO15273.1 1-acyl-sn-glycerol-3-phosphate acyltransferase [Actinomycetota bacterium]HUM86594.1 1-acyl-sn-glycerol-3-phosphate acyltransferase [Actinomycetota bacterium]
MNRIIDALVDIATDASFRSVEVRRAEPEPRGPVLVVANHGGGLGDILTVIAGSRRFPRFLARDIIWKFPIARQVMNAVRAIPVSRRQDHGAEADNTSMFDAAYTGLQEGDLLAIYPEGESVPEPRLAPLRTGAARILLGAWERGVDTAILPMGLHYFDISVLRGRCLVQVGPPVLMSSLVPGLPSDEPLSENNHDAVHALTEVIADRLGDVVAEYADWDQRRRFETAAAVYLIGRPDTTAVSYSELATTAELISRADPDLQRAVTTRVRAYSAQVELLGLPDTEVPDLALTGIQMAGRAARVLAMTPLAVYGALVNGIPMAGLRLISLTGVAPATAASLKPAFALIAFPAAWAALGWWGYRRAGIRGAVAVAATGPAGLAATIKVAEQGQLLFLVSRAYRRANGTVLEQFEHARQDLVETVGAALATAQPSVTR